MVCHVIDVRPRRVCARHLPGALNIPLGNWASFGRAPGGREIIAYCRGPYCVLSFEASAATHRELFSASAEDGYPDEGLPVADRSRAE